MLYYKGLTKQENVEQVVRYTSLMCTGIIWFALFVAYYIDEYLLMQVNELSCSEKLNNVDTKYINTKVNKEFRNVIENNFIILYRKWR